MHVLPNLGDYSFWMRCMMDDTKAIDQVVLHGGHKIRQRLRIGLNKRDAVCETLHFCPLPGKLERFFRKINSRNTRASAGKIDRVCTHATADFQNGLVFERGNSAKSGM